MENEVVGGIYGIRNIANDKIYIGLSSDIYKRWKVHRNMLNKGEHINAHLQSAWNEYGENSFEFFIIEKISFDNKDKMKIREKYWIKKYKSSNNSFGYNMNSGGDGVRDLDPISLEKKSIAKSTKPVVQITLDGKYVQRFRNATKAEEFFNKPNNTNIWYCCSKYYGFKTAYGFIWMFEEDYIKNGVDLKYHEKGGYKKAIIQMSMDGKYIVEYESAREAERQTGIGYKLISRVCRGEREYTCGFRFKFKEMNPIFQSPETIKCYRNTKCKDSNSKKMN